MTTDARMRYRLRATTGRPKRGPEPEDIAGVIEYLARDGSAVLESLDEPDTYIQVWLRPEGTYQLELRDGSPEHHVRTLTISRDKVAAAFTAWLAHRAREEDRVGSGSGSGTGAGTAASSSAGMSDGAAAWRGDFHWEDISHQFTSDITPDA